MADIINSCNEILYVNNPPVNTGDEDEERAGRKDREASRKILLDHMHNCSTFVRNYKPSNLDSLNERIEGPMNEIEKQEKEVKELQEKLKEELSDKKRNELEKEIENV